MTNSSFALPSRRFIRRLLALFMPLAALVLLLSIYAYQSEKTREIGNKSSEELASVELGEGAISDVLDVMRNDVAFIANDPSLMNYLKDSSAANKTHFSQDLLNFASSHRVYDQVRWLDQHGMERIRVNNDGGEPLLVSEGELQSKKDRYYFVDAIKLNPGETYVSPLDLNIEHGKIDMPFKPMLRIATPVIDSNGNKRGVVVLNYLATHLFSRFAAFIAGTADHVMLLNKEGFFLKSPNASEEWGFMLGRNDLTLSSRFPEAWKRISSSSKGQFLDSDGLWTFATDYPLFSGAHPVAIGTIALEPDAALQAQARQWKVVSHLPTERLLARTNDLLFKMYFLVPLLLLICFEISRRSVQGYFRRLAETSLRVAAKVFESKQGMMVTDSNANILRVNQSFTDITGYTSNDVVGKTPRILSSGKHDSSFYRTMWNELIANDRWEGEIWNRRKDGELFPEYLTISAVRDTKSRITNFVGTFNDISLIKKAEEKIEHLALYDQLTDLPNRKLLLDRLQQAFLTSQRNSKQGALLYIDVNGFRSLNDTIGHDMGNVLLQGIAERLATCVRSGDTLARVGGDEFVLILVDLGKTAVETATNAELLAEKLHAAISRPFKLGLNNHHCSIAIGATIFDGGEIDANLLIGQAEIAMYQNMQSELRSGVQFFDSMMQATVSARAEMENELHIALDNGQFELYYQIQVDERHQAIGAESLIRWNNPKLGLVSPAQFIPLAEETGIIFPMSRWVLESACTQLKRWEKDERTQHLMLAVNISSKSFLQSSFVSEVKSIVERHAIRSGFLKLELTESTMLDRVHETIAKMTELKAIGIQFSIDDFGTGYSSLQYLKLLPINQLKIDQAFVRDIAIDENDRIIVSTIISMARSLQLDVIAEGVETDVQRRLLVEMGCHRFQGYLFSKPVPSDAFEKLLGL
jgi:diguanylate cyclase (GGDEF)-like protein/PAS domain S-box-containing protein